MTGRDVQQWIGGGVCLLDRTEPVKYITVNRDRIIVRALNTANDTLIELSEADRLAAYWPRCGSLNVPGGAIYLLRQQQQQYRRTYNPRALTIIYPDKWAMLKVNPAFVRRYSNVLDDAVVGAAFNPEYPSWDDAMLMLEGQPNVAINEQIILGGTPDLLTVYHKGKKCGNLINGNFVPAGRALPLSRIYKLLQGRITVC
jgi:hypothetical protein